MIIAGGTCYFTIHYVRGFQTQLPDEFTASINEEGNGCLIIRYGGRRIPVIVRQRRFGSGWRTFINFANVVSGTTLLVAHSGGRILSLLKFRRGMGVKSAWYLNANAFDVESGLVEEADELDEAPGEIIRTSYFPEHMSIFFARPSGVCTFKQTSYLSMRVPHNLAHHLRSKRQTSVNIRSGDRVFGGITVELGYFRGCNWSNMVEACEFDVGFKIFLFINVEEDFEMI